MMRIEIILLLCLGWGVSVVYGQEKDYRIKGNIEGAEAGTKVYLSDQRKAVVDSTVVENGSFQFVGRVETPALHIISLGNDKRKAPCVPLFVENTAISITARWSELSNERDFLLDEYNYEKVDVRGSRSQVVFQNFLKEYAKLVKSRKLVLDEYSLFLGADPGKRSKEQGISIVTEYDRRSEEMNAFVLDFSEHNADSPVALYLLTTNIVAFSKNDIEKAIRILSPIMSTTKEGKAFVERAERVKKTAVGADFLDFNLQDTIGREIKLSDYVGKGSYVLLEFWASWCGPCRREIPHLKEVYKVYNPKGFDIISVSMDDKREAWVKAVEEERMPWMQLSDLRAFKSDIAKAYNIRGIPTCILIDPEGRIQSRNMRGSWMDKMLLELF